MRLRVSRIGAEIALLALILATLAGSVALVVTVYRVNRPVKSKPAMVVQAPPQVIAPSPPKPPEIVVAPPPPEDLTPARLAEIAAQETAIVEANKALEHKAASLEAARATSKAAADRYRVRERLIRLEASKADKEARHAEDDVDLLARERDALAAKRDEERKDLEFAQLRARDGVAVLPYKGANGTWRRPIAIECRAATAQLQPGGPIFTIDDLSGFVNRRTHPLVTSVARAMVRSRDLASPDGAPTVPYLYFIVRPDGIRLFYAARGLLEPLGIAFGYELVDADWDIEFPDLNDPRQWTDTPSGTKPAAWPPPPSADELAGGTGPGTGAGREGSGVRPGLNPPGSVLGGMGDGVGEERSGMAPPNPGASGARRLGVTASRNSREETERAWSKLGTTRDLAYGGLDPDDLESLSRGDGRGGTFQDGRVPVVPSDLEPAPALERPPSAEILGEFSERGTAQPDARRDPRRSQPQGSAGRVPGLVGEVPSPVSGDGRQRSLSDAIARNEGLTPPSLSVPSRSIPLPPGSAGGMPALSPARGSGNSTSALPPQGTSATPSGSPGGSAGSSGEKPPGAQPSASSTSGGGMPSSGTGGGEGQGQAWDDSNGITSKTFEVNVACGPKGVVIYPGGQTVDLAEMTTRDDALPRTLATIVRNESDANPNVGLRPKVKFLVKPGGEATYLKAQYQVARSGTNWPTTMKVADRSTPRLFDGARP